MLVHGMLDYVVDGYFEITQDFDDVIEDLDDVQDVFHNAVL